MQKCNDNEVVAKRAIRAAVVALSIDRGATHVCVYKPSQTRASGKDAYREKRAGELVFSYNLPAEARPEKCANAARLETDKRDSVAIFAALRCLSRAKEGS